MKREIKFRAYGYNPMVKKKVMMGGFTLEELYKNLPKADFSKMIWMQYTGLKDKNGTEIYEGDIVKCENGNFEVKWGHFTNNVNSDEYSEAHYGYYIGEDEQFEDFEQIWNANLFEVIGNIYENKENL